MPRTLSFDEDRALKRLVTMPRDQKPDFSWREGLAASAHPLTGITVTRTNGDEQSFNLSDVADEIGEALTDLLLSREEKNIFNEQNRGFVANVAHSVALSLAEQSQKGGSLRLSEHDLSLLIEKALIENDAHDVAKSLVFKRSIRSGGASTLAQEAEPLNVRLIRRNGSVVPWMESKIEAACRRAFLSMKENAEAAASIARDTAATSPPRACLQQRRREGVLHISASSSHRWLPAGGANQPRIFSSSSLALVRSFRAHRWLLGRRGK